MLTHMSGYAMTCFFSIICFHFYYFHTAYVIFFSLVSVWNGANFYMEYFSKKYEKDLANLDIVEKKLNEASQETKTKEPKVE